MVPHPTVIAPRTPHEPSGTEGNVLGGEDVHGQSKGEASASDNPNEYRHVGSAGGGRAIIVEVGSRVAKQP